MIPTTIDEAIQALIKNLCIEDQVAITRMVEEDIITLHHTLGRWMRNNWGLWSGGPLMDHMKSLGFMHADDMSCSLIREFWARMNNLPSKMVEGIEEYKKFWKENDK